MTAPIRQQSCNNADTICLGDRAMNSRTKEIAFAVCLGLVLPSLIFRFGNQKSTTLQSAPEEEKKEQMTISVQTEDGNTIQIPLETYVTRVVLGEMPARFEEEALKAQAVVARTYALKLQSSGDRAHSASVCTDSNCCQAYCTEQTYLSYAGTEADLNKIRSAVEATAGQVLIYNGELAEATYFSCSGGRTEDAIAVWGSEVPYLQSVDSPGEENAENYIKTVSFTRAEFAEKMGLSEELLNGSWIGAITYTRGGGVDTITFCGKTFRGTTVRKNLGLRSTAFVVTAVGNTITLTTKGSGHRVGMSQYGADAMARTGKNYNQILQYYYCGTQLQTLV